MTEIKTINKHHEKNIQDAIKNIFNKYKPNLFTTQTEEDKKELQIKLKEYLSEFEGLKLKAYKDTENNLTIGYGHKLTKHEIENKQFNITQEQAEYMLINDIEKAKILAKDIYPNYEQHKANIRLFMILQCFNMGNNLRSFKISNPHLINFEYEKAYHGFKNSKWCKQVKSNRCIKTINLLLKEEV